MASGSDTRYVVRKGTRRPTGRFFAQVQGQNGKFGVDFAPWAVSDDASPLPTRLAGLGGDDDECDHTDRDDDGDGERDECHARSPVAS